jgi:hypothetical protein
MDMDRFNLKKLNEGDIKEQYQVKIYADDIALIAITKKALIEIFNKISEEAALVGRHINEGKTKYMHIQKTVPRNKRPLQINN